ncbi:MAG: ice-binding family protein [Actinomycetota bacterium]|nr:ice-binding family protein [Actinomycetota bacterium]
MRQTPVVRSLLGAIVLMSGLVVLSPATAHAATSPPLGSAATFAVLGASTVTNTGPTAVTGDLGVSPGTAVVGFPPGSVTGTIHTTDAVAAQAQADIGTAITFTAAQACDADLTGQDLGGRTLAPGVYCFNSSAQLTGTLTLDARGDPNAAWIINVPSSLTTGSNAAVVLTGGATPCNNNNITWLIGASATIGTGTSFIGNILAHTSITLAAAASSSGSLYAHTGAVTMDTNMVSTCAGTGGKANPTITTIPSGSVPVGGEISDTANLTGGASPTGTVTFTLFGPGDNTCTTPVATRTGVLDANTAVSGPVTANTAGVYNWMAVYNGDGANNPVTSPCGSEQVTVTSQVLTGRAYGLGAKATLLGLPLVTVAPIPDTGFIATPTSSTTSTPCVASVSGMVSARALCASVTTVASPSSSTARASVADAGVSLVNIPTVTMRVVHSSSYTTCAGSTGTTTIDFLKVGNTVVISVPTQVAPNTSVNVGVVSLILNEQIPFSVPDDGLTVNAVHMKVNTLGLAKVDVVVASSESDIANCP